MKMNTFLSFASLIAIMLLLSVEASAQMPKRSEVPNQYFVKLTSEALNALSPPRAPRARFSSADIFQEALFFRRFGMIPLKKNVSLKGVYLIQVVDKRLFKAYQESSRLFTYVEPVLETSVAMPLGTVFKAKTEIVQRKPIPQQQRQTQTTQQRQAQGRDSSNVTQSLALSALSNNDPEDNNIGLNAGTGANVRNAWDITTGSSDVIIGVLGSGVHLAHPDLAGNLWKDLNPSATDLKESSDGFNVFNTTSRTPPNDDQGYGTYAAGIIGAKGQNALGIAGVAWNVKIIPVRIAKKNAIFSSRLDTDVAKLIDGIDYLLKKKAEGHNIQVIYNFLNVVSDPSSLSPTLRAIIDEAAAKGILFVTAAGDIPADLNTAVSIPGNFSNPNVISVGAYRQFTDLVGDHIEYLSTSNRGSCTVHLAAPGQDVKSTWIGNQYYTPATGNTIASGAFVAGAAVLLRASFPTATYQELKSKLMRSVRHYPAELGGKFANGGALDVYRALTYVPPTLAGDYNGDGTVDNADYNAWKANFGNTGPSPADGNRDGVVDAADYVVWRDSLGASIYLSGDYNRDDIVNQLDYDVWRSNFGSTGSNPADGNGSGTVDAADYTIWRDNTCY